jgi:hypothetical protein
MPLIQAELTSWETTGTWSTSLARGGLETESTGQHKKIIDLLTPSTSLERTDIFAWVGREKVSDIAKNCGMARNGRSAAALCGA